MPTASDHEIRIISLRVDQDVLACVGRTKRSAVRRMQNLRAMRISNAQMRRTVVTSIKFQ